jgi:outer membrane murein-binding lipoprotein Lpp
MRSHDTTIRRALIAFGIIAAVCAVMLLTGCSSNEEAKKEAALASDAPTVADDDVAADLEDNYDWLAERIDDMP